MVWGCVEIWLLADQRILITGTPDASYLLDPVTRCISGSALCMYSGLG
jgi:hypothetical protein